MTEIQPGLVVAGVIGGLLFLLVLAIVAARLIQPKTVPRIDRSIRAAHDQLFPTARTSSRLITSGKFLPQKTYFQNLHENSTALRDQNRLTNQQMAEASLTGPGPRYSALV